MCGRYVLIKLHPDGEFLVLNWQDKELHTLSLGYNLAPSQSVTVLTYLALGKMRPTQATWGFTSVNHAGLIINARSESITAKPMFRQAFASRRCLVPADGWYEWCEQGEKKQPHYIDRRDGRLLTFGGILQPNPIPAMAIVTTNASPELATIHHRMPVIIPEQLRADWLNPQTPTHDVLKMLAPLSGNFLKSHPVSRRVNSPKVNDKSLVAPVEITIEKGLFDP